MDDVDRRLLSKLQEGLPLISRPFLEIGKELGLEEEEVLSRINALKEGGQIRRLGGVFNSPALGYVSALCALKALPGEEDDIARMINSVPGVTHNYLRDDPELNIWFTLTCTDEAELKKSVRLIEEATGKKVHLYRARRRYKIRFCLPFKAGDDDA